MTIRTLYDFSVQFEDGTLDLIDRDNECSLEEAKAHARRLARSERLPVVLEVSTYDEDTYEPECSAPEIIDTFR